MPICRPGRRPATTRPRAVRSGDPATCGRTSKPDAEPWTGRAVEGDDARARPRTRGPPRGCLERGLGEPGRIGGGVRQGAAGSSHGPAAATSPTTTAHGSAHGLDRAPSDRTGAPGSGAWIRLTVRETRRRTPADVALEVRTLRPWTRSLAGARVLVVDDDPALSEVVGRYLERRRLRRLVRRGR